MKGVWLSHATYLNFCPPKPSVELLKLETLHPVSSIAGIVWPFRVTSTLVCDFLPPDSKCTPRWETLMVGVSTPGVGCGWNAGTLCEDTDISNAIFPHIFHNYQQGRTASGVLCHTFTLAVWKMVGHLAHWVPDPVVWRSWPAARQSPSVVLV